MDNEIKECEFLEKEVDGCYLAGCIPKGYKTITNFKCKNNPNCYYKQLLTEQAKNSELEATLKILKINHKLTMFELNNEQAKNKKLVEALEKITTCKYSYKYCCEGCSLFEVRDEDNCFTCLKCCKNIANQALNEVNK